MEGLAERYAGCARSLRTPSGCLGAAAEGAGAYLFRLTARTPHAPGKYRRREPFCDPPRTRCKTVHIMSQKWRICGYFVTLAGAVPAVSAAILSTAESHRPDPGRDARG